LGELAAKLTLPFQAPGRRDAPDREPPAFGPLHGLLEGEVKAAAHRLRQGFCTALRRATAGNVTSKEELDDEIRHGFTVFQAP